MHEEHIEPNIHPVPGFGFAATFITLGVLAGLATIFGIVVGLRHI